MKFIRGIRRRLRPWLPDAGFFVLMLIMLSTWLLAIPRWASPDEPEHVYKAYGTAHGQLLGREIIRDPPVPSNIRQFDGPVTFGLGDIRCYFFRPESPAGCDLGARPELESSAARYPPYYYALVGGGARLVGQPESVRTYRLFSALLCTAMLAGAFALLRRSRSRRLAPLMLVTMTPMALFMMASVNPNATEISGFILIWALLTRLCVDDQPSKRFSLALGITAAVLIMFRPISAVWLACVGIIVLIAASPTRRREFFRKPFLVRLLVPLTVGVVASLAWLRFAAFKVSDSRVATNLTLREVVRLSVDRWHGYYLQMVGVLGWLDTNLPTVTYWGWSIAIIAVAAIHLTRSGPRQWLTLAALVGAYLVTPIAINASTAASAGLSFQGRYSLPVFAGLAFLPMLDDRHLKAVRSSTLLMYVALAVITVAEVAGFWQMLRRFSVGASGKIWLVGDLPWQPGKIWLVGDLPWQPGIPPMLLIGVNAIVMILLCVTTVLITRRSHAEPTDENDPIEEFASAT